MSIISRSIPGLFGGVSQQFPAMRHPTQGDQQDNALSTVVAGLYKRPGSSHVAFTPQYWVNGDEFSGNAFIHAVDRGENERWGVILDGEGVKVINMVTGAAETVTISSGASYLLADDPRNSFRCVTVADTTFVVNTNQVVQSSGVDPFTPDNRYGYIYVKTGAPQQTYSVTVNAATTGSHTSGTSTNVEGVASGIVSALTSVGITAAVVGGVSGLIQVYVASGITSLSVTDTFGNATMLVVSNGVTKFSDLPPRYVAGQRVKIAGSGPNVDPYWVTWNGSQYTGTEWVECLAPGKTMGFTAASMPHKLTRSGGGGTWVFEQCSWDARKVGDDDTNPDPSFVGRKLRDIFFHRNRLGFLAGASLCMSRSGLYFNFYAATATDVLDTDPIDLGGAAEAIDTLDWAVPFNLELIVWATSKQQFSLASGDVLSPNTARLVPTTAFATNNTARPKQLGNRIIYANTTQGHTQMGLYRISRDTVSNTMESVTDHAPSYIPDNLLSIEVSEAFRIVAMLPPGPTNELYVFKYEDDGEKLTQRAWQRFNFGCDSILKAHWSNSKLYLFCYYKDMQVIAGQSQDGIALEVIDFNYDLVDEGASVDIKLDRKVVPTVTTDTPAVGQTTVTLPFRVPGPLSVLKSSDGYTLEYPVLSHTLGDTSTTIVVRGTWFGGHPVVGSKYLMRYRFSEIFMRDTEGVPVMSLRLKLMKLLLRHTRTGFFKVNVKTRALGDYTYQFTGEGVGFGLGLGTQPTLRDGDFNVPIQAQASGTSITIESDSFLPCIFPYAEWRGSVNLKANR